MMQFTLDYFVQDLDYEPNLWPRGSYYCSTKEFVYTFFIDTPLQHDLFFCNNSGELLEEAIGYDGEFI